jgi:hypothetical protein
MANYKNTEYSVVTGNQTLPISATGTGTVTTDGKSVIGVGTKFITEMPAGSWLVDLANTEIRRITSVESDTVAYFTNPFTVGLSADAISVIHERLTNVVAISVKAVGGAILIDGSSLPDGEAMTFSKDSRDDSGQNDFVDPIIVDANGNSILALIMR